jgi:uncharacterized protein YdhG (YjbR/CyaY superfamily)
MKPEAKTAFKTVAEYIEMFPGPVQKALEKLRQIIRKAAPEAEEVISYAMPGYKQNGVAIWFAAYKNHYAIYVRPKIHEAFAAELAAYKQTKSAIHFSYTGTLPEKLIADITQYAIAENLENARLKKEAKNEARHEFSILSAPARRALKNHGIQNLKQLSGYSEAAILALHGMGKSSMPKLKNELEKHNLSFKK